MSAPVYPGATRPNNQRPSGPPAGYNPNLQRGPDHSLSQNFQNLQLNQPQNAPSQPPFGGPRGPPPFGQNAPPFAGPSPVSRPGPPPPGVVPRGVMPPGGPPQNMIPPNMGPGRPTGPMPSQPPPFASRGPPPGAPPPFQGSQPVPQQPSARPTAFGSSPLTAGPVPSSSTQPRPISNGPPSFSSGGFPGGPPGSSVGTQQSFVRGPPSFGAQSPMMHPHLGSQHASGPAAPPTESLSGPSQPVSPFSVVPQHAQPPSGSSFGQQVQQPWQTQPRQVAPSLSSSLQPPSMYGMPPPISSQNMAGAPPAVSHIGGPMASKVDPSQIPRPFPSSSVILYETRQGNQANPPPPATTEFIVTDTGNCSPRNMRCTISQIPCTSELLTTSGMPLALLVQPFALPHPSEEPIQVVDFGERGPLRCSRCKGYINPFMKFIDQGRQFICNLCGFTDETPRDYQCNLGPDGRRRDADERPELSKGTVEFVATKEYMVRDPMPAVFFFVVDVSMNAIQTGATAAACSAINQVIADLPEGPRTMVGIATFDSTIHFYNLKRALQQPLMLIVPDVHDVYTPLETDIIVQLSECRQHLELLLESIPTMFQSNMIADSAFGAAVKAAYMAMKSSGGKLLVFQSVLPSLGISALSVREAEGRANALAGDKEAHKLLQPADKTLREMALELAEYQVCVDVFLTTQSYMDIVSISVVPRTTGGQVYYYYPFSSLSDTAKLYNDLRWNVSRPQGFEAVMRVRCSQGLQVQEYTGNFCKRIPTDVDLPAIDCDKTITVTLKHDDKLQDGAECAFQCAILYTTVYGQRRIRVMNLSLSCTSALPNLFRSADLDAQFTCFLKQAGNEIPTLPLSQVREHATNHCVNILHSYRKFCSTVQSTGQLILPEALKLLPLYTLALTKSTGLRTDGRIDDRSFWMTYVSSVSAPLGVPLVYPRLIAVHDLISKETDGSLIPSALPLSSENISDDGIYLLENGLDALIYIGNSVNSNILQQLFGFSSVAEIPTQFVLQQHDNSQSKKLNEVINEIRRQRCSYLRLKLCKQGDSSGMLFFSYMVEDKSPLGLSYVEFLVHIHRQIQVKMD
ncbi:protein transport protein Sec24-like At4g32640 [Chenopodium quinoa]|uniref:protein transport protein Sec24-like At4g32640 n=1 Tax=Chenopodium quinoa TaxID=63459 RepID=UPI000B788E8F|nr:protein transport protein Sec24-like At4g32640 [Chenopodium quinoa]